MLTIAQIRAVKATIERDRAFAKAFVGLLRERGRRDPQWARSTMPIVAYEAGTRLMDLTGEDWG